MVYKFFKFYDYFINNSLASLIYSLKEENIKSRQYDNKLVFRKKINMIDQKVKINAFFKDDKIYRLVFYIKIKKDENINLIDEELSKKYSLFYEKLNEAHYKANSFLLEELNIKVK